MLNDTETAIFNSVFDGVEEVHRDLNVPVHRVSVLTATAAFTAAMEHGSTIEELIAALTSVMASLVEAVEKGGTPRKAADVLQFPGGDDAV